MRASASFYAVFAWVKVEFEILTLDMLSAVSRSRANVLYYAQF